MDCKNSNVLISIIVPVYNVEQYLSKCLDSIINQTYKNLEIILIDDGSTDKSGEICDKYKDEDSRIKVIHKINAGVSAARNDGIDIAEGTYVTFVDSDDWIEEDYINLAIACLTKYRPDILINNYKRYNKNNSNYVNMEPIFFDKQEALFEMIRGKHFNWSPVATFYSTKICKLNKFDSNINYGEDLLFKYNFIKNSKNILYVPLVKYFYTNRETSACNSYAIDKKMDDLYVMEYIMEKEKNKIGNILMENEYLPRLISRYKILKLNDSYIYKELKTVLNNKIKRMLVAKFFSMHISIKNKVKLLACFMPKQIIYFLIKINNLINKKDDTSET